MALVSRETIADRIAYLKRNRGWFDELPKSDRTKVINFLKTRLESPNMGFKAADNSRKARGFGDLSCVIQEILTSASRPEIEEIAEKFDLMS
jgi:hypothetical protein